MNDVTILGKRQTGKSEMLIALSAWLIREGQKVLYVAHDMTTVREKMRRLQQGVGDNDGYKFWWGNGDESCDHKSGGRVVFASGRSSRGRGFNCDTLILDEVDFYPHASPDAKFVYCSPAAAET